ncbi:hypothetical protein AKJ09_09451 [Labilithrix luteola]|uniref:Murein endopeptidase n=1 Tax=Labilithrix luteola TaxID=1391654 RepID=A0A0K1QAN0_9BACT|nr:penicillin-insensitive murein endopeptidase [Labilithrix luteola]AKV02788.1 hypothetical protein AKJ09_09451 [Labilithrix luteola]
MRPFLRHLRALAGTCGLVAGACVGSGCASVPSPLTPHYEGSVGLPHRGVLTAPEQLACEGEALRCLRDNDRHYAIGRFVATIDRAAKDVAKKRPGARLTVGDLSAKSGGHISSHSSHRSGRDADLLLYMTTLDGVPVPNPDFVHVGPDGLAWDPVQHRYLRFDVEREWLLVKTLLEDPEARIQWLFVSKPVKAMLLEWARARGESGETMARALDVLVQPSPPAQNHDDHIHVRTACTPEELRRGCEDSGPTRPWLAALDTKAVTSDIPVDNTRELLEAITRPIDTSPDTTPVANDAKASR